MKVQLRKLKLFLSEPEDQKSVNLFMAQPSTKSIVIFFITILFGTISDLLSKWIVFEKYRESGYVVLIPDFIGLICSTNKGIAFGLFPSRSNVLIYLTIFAIILIAWIYYNSDKSNTLITIGLAAILSGAIGNLWDRIYFRSVRDFIDIHIGDYHWPTFNIADMLICVGVGLLIFRNISPRGLKDD